ncbi:hypothetical protein [Paraburkholderia xenovorans]|jgi:tetratricopeptide (TPR) repeat protein
MLEKERPRRVVPRWRSSAVTARTAEAWTKRPKVAVSYADEVASKAREFEADHSVPIAAELMYLASEAGDSDTAKRAASVIIENAGKIGPSQLVRSAKRVLDVADEQALEAPAADFIREARKLLAVDYRNPVLLMDVARALTVKRQEASARRYVRAAVALAPQSRFIVRAAARYYLHIGEYEIAHDVLSRSPLLKSDPWVQASEIAIATVRGRTSSLAKQKSRLLSEEKHTAPDVSELASAVATVELLSGADKRAKILFQKALLHPNDNSLAQVEWAATKLKLIVDDSALRTPLSYEANSSNAYRKLMVEEAIAWARRWQEDEPFASRPYDSLCYLYSLDGQFAAAQAVAEGSVEMDGGHNYSSNLNLLFCKIQNGELDQAFRELMLLAGRPDAKRHATHLLANAGALAYATGEFERGKQFYERAIRAARSRNDPRSEALARAFFARTASASADPSAAAIIAEAATSVERLPSPGAIYVMRSLVDADRKRQLEEKASARVAKRKWEWDMATNTLRVID